jgi:phospho-N-acetylmuramoyl-pentapeptide-transferase
VFAEYLQIHYVAGTGELAVLCGSGDRRQSRVFSGQRAAGIDLHGDTDRSRSAGCSARLPSPSSTRSCWRSSAGLFVLEAVSVIVQVVSFKLTGKRVFKMAPIHHHYEQLGWTEPQIVIRFWIVAVVLALAGLATLKLR